MAKAAGIHCLARDENIKRRKRDGWRTGNALQARDSPKIAGTGMRNHPRPQPAIKLVGLLVSLLNRRDAESPTTVTQ